jgi:hypothetical protein
MTYRIVPISVALCVLLHATGLQGQELAGDGERAGTRIIIKDVKRDDGGTVTLRFQMTNDDETPEGIYQILGGYLPDRVHLIEQQIRRNT